MGVINVNFSKDLGYKQMRAKLGMRKVRPWKWMAFTNPARYGVVLISRPRYGMVLISHARYCIVLISHARCMA